MARSMGLSWAERGPPAPAQGGPSTWRGQTYRRGSGRWANRGGQLKEWYTGFYQAKKEGGAYLDEWLHRNPKPRKCAGGAA